MKTRITELFGIKYPIMLAGMNWLTEPEIVAAVCNAGGLGNLAISRHTPDGLRADIKKIRELTDKPFAVNQILMAPSAKANLPVVIEEKVPVVNYTLGRPPEIVPLIKAVHNYGGKILATVALVKHAVRAEQLGADAINITGHEAAAHGGYATSMVLIPLVANSIKVPFFSAGGFFDGRGLAAALALGADGITMGTRFAMTKECRLHDKWKQTVIKSSEQDTVYIDVGDPAVNQRVFKNKKAEDSMKKRFPLVESVSGAFAMKRLLNLSWWGLISSGISSSKGEGGMSMREQLLYAASAARANKVMFDGDEDAGVLAIGQVIGGIRDVPTCKELIERIVAQAETTAAKVQEKALAK
ncbi:MAG: nitronate monooxygenase [Dehalococcoidales bacterium]|nr:nitronate monooxygenase [Dehalococcoidales bacterium]